MPLASNAPKVKVKMLAASPILLMTSCGPILTTVPTIFMVGCITDQFKITLEPLNFDPELRL